MLISLSSSVILTFFFFNPTATTEIYTLSLHDALPIWRTSTRTAAPAAPRVMTCPRRRARRGGRARHDAWGRRDRKSTRLNSSHVRISYAVFCLKKKKKKKINEDRYEKIISSQSTNKRT